MLEPGRLETKGPFDIVILQGHSAAGMSDKRRASFREKVVEFNGKPALFIEVMRAESESAIDISEKVRE